MNSIWMVSVPMDTTRMSEVEVGLAQTCNPMMPQWREGTEGTVNVEWQNAPKYPFACNELFLARANYCSAGYCLHVNWLQISSQRFEIGQARGLIFDEKRAVGADIKGGWDGRQGS